MCNNNTYDLPLALIMEEILQWEQPNKGGKGKGEQEQEEQAQED